jgi:hypothetical protein
MMERILVLDIPLKGWQGSKDYDNPKYVEGYAWTEEDREIIKLAIANVYNDTDSEGEKPLETSLGTVIITFEKHTESKRHKNIKGFLIPKNSSPAACATDESKNEDCSQVFEYTVIIKIKDRNEEKIFKAKKYKLEDGKHYFYNDDTDDPKLFVADSELSAIINIVPINSKNENHES